MGLTTEDYKKIFTEAEWITYDNSPIGQEIGESTKMTSHLVTHPDGTKDIVMIMLYPSWAEKTFCKDCQMINSFCSCKNFN